MEKDMENLCFQMNSKTQNSVYQRDFGAEKGVMLWKMSRENNKLWVGKLGYIWVVHIGYPYKCFLIHTNVFLPIQMFGLPNIVCYPNSVQYINQNKGDEL